MFTAELYTNDKKLARIALRRFRMNEKEYYLAVNPDTLETGLVPVGEYLLLKRPLDDIRTRYKNLAYVRALEYSERNSGQLQNAGITHISGIHPAIYVTADLCPTKRSMDRSLLERLVNEYTTFQQPAPVALSVAGKWLKNHPDNVEWILGMVAARRLSVTWINHSYSHRHKMKVPWWKNFLLEAGSHVDLEITQNEVCMMESGLMPSVFFRFPGLVSRRALFTEVTKLGLIPLGSDAWLGKKQWPVSGSIILLHANGQEPVGILRFLRWLDITKGNSATGKLLLRDIREGVSEMMKMY